MSSPFRSPVPPRFRFALPARPGPTVASRLLAVSRLAAAALLAALLGVSTFAPPTAGAGPSPRVSAAPAPGMRAVLALDTPRLDLPDSVQPGWQQEVRYTTEAFLDEEADVLRAAQTVRYRNASPDTLRALYFHLYLNAFRPHSVWARHERRERLPFGSLEEPDYGFERLQRVRLAQGRWPADGEPMGREAGRALRAAYPHAPDSTVVRFDLPRPLAPGDSAALYMEWTARPATLCRRQCREGRHWDFAQWYPRVAPYDAGGWQVRPLYPQGEFYGEFATYDVTLDLAEDQVVGATGVPVEGDPGWRPAATSPEREIDLRRNFYGERFPAAPPDFLERRSSATRDSRPAATGEGRRRVRFYAEDVHHFAWSVNPDYAYEGVVAQGPDGGTPIHVLYRPGDLEWDLGAAARRTARALGWLERTFGPYPYPHLTNLHRLEGGGTEFPMVMMNGGPGQGLITHEATHQYAHGILANNEWAEGWLDEGLTTFLTAWFEEEHGAPDPWSDLTRSAAEAARAGVSEHPVATPGHEFADYGTYGAMTYTKPAAVFRMLRWLVGKETTREILRAYYREYRFEHVSEEDLRAVAEAVSGRELDWFFDQWLHTLDTLDYAVEEATTERAAGGEWRTRVAVRREGGIWMPVTLRVGETERRLDSRERRFTVEVTTGERPEEARLDPERTLLDLDRSNDAAPLGTPPSRP